MKKAISILTLIFSILSYGQLMPSASTQGTITNVNTPVDLFSGIATVSVPVYTIEGNNGFQVPISLIYQTNAPRVADIPPPVGLGWQLSTGGVITRVLLSQPDDQTQFIENDDYQKLKDVAIDGNDTYDFEKDVFYFSFPGGSGRFILNGNSEVISLPANDLDIEFFYASASGSYFVITDILGNKYKFGSSSTSRDETSSTSITDSDPSTQNTRSFISSWHLDEVIFADLPEADRLRYTYSRNTIVSESASASLFGRQDPSNPDIHFIDNPPTVTETTTTITAAKVEAITFSKGEVLFDYSDRVDVTTSQKLSQIRVRSGSQDIYDIDLGYVYANASGSIQLSGASCTRPECYRLMLKNISINGHEIRSFDYINEEVTFGIDNYELPPRDSYLVNTQGHYYAGRPNELLPYEVDEFDRFEGASDLDGQSLAAQANMLKKISYSTGGYTEFEYSVGIKGVKVESISNKIGNKLISGSNYTYYTPVDFPSSRLKLYYDVGLLLFSHSISDAFDLTPREGYRDVTVTDAKTGASKKTEFYIWEPREADGGLMPAGQVPNSQNDLVTAPRKFIYYFNISTNTVAELDEDENLYPRLSEPPYSSYPLLDYKIGLPKKEYIYDESGSLTATTSYEYIHGSESHSFRNRTFFRGINIEPWEGSGGKFAGKWHKILASEYSISCKPLYLDKTVSTVFDESENPVSEVTSQYSYHTTYKSLPNVIKTYRSDAGEAFNSKVYTYYPMDYNEVDLFLDTEYGYNPAVLNEMVSKNMVSIPLAKRYEVSLPEYQGTPDEYRVNKIDFTVFEKFYNRIYPHKSYTYNFPKPHIYGSVGYYNVIDPGPELISTMSYNDKGLISSMIGLDGINTSYVYDSDGYILTKTIDPGVTGMEQTTNYSHKPLVGIEAITDHTNETITYEYDSHNRLHLIRDEDNNIIKRYRYNQKTENTDLVADISLNGLTSCIFRNNTVTINSGNDDSYGTSDHHWRIYKGAELIYENSTNNYSIDYIFTNTGNYRIDLDVHNPEYGEIASDTYNLNVLQNSNIELCGPYTYDICTNQQGYPYPRGCISNNGNNYISMNVKGVPSGSGATYSWKFRTIDEGSIGGTIFLPDTGDSIFLDEFNFSNSSTRAVADKVIVTCDVTYCDGMMETVEQEVNIIFDGVCSN